MHSRDELRSRATEIEPQWHDLGDDLSPGLRGNWPTDPDAGGTWVGVHENGLFLGLLNLNLTEDELPVDLPAFTRSRGLIIPELLKLGSVESALSAIRDMDLLGTSPFRLVFIGLGQDQEYKIAVVRFDGMQLTTPTELTALNRPLCWASSGLGDGLVQCRLPLFESMISADMSSETQRDFHWHQWEDRPEFSVMMSREDARTSSITTIEVERGDEPKIVYEPIAVGDPKADPVGAGMLR
jgi:hypothetical protein